jgi:hypothetical protein
LYPFLYQLGGILMNDESYIDTENYCFQESENNETLDWNLLVCETNLFIMNKLHILCDFLHFYLRFSVSVVSILCLSVTIFVYAYVHELRSTVAGKILLFFLSSYLVAVIGFSIFHYHYTLDKFALFIAFGFLSGFIWMTALIFDSWFSLR